MILSDNVATLIHDLKNPIIAQERVLDLLLKNAFGELNESQTEIIAQIKESCEYLKNIVYKTMDNYRSNSVEIILQPESFDFNSLVKSVVEELEILAKENSKTIKFNCHNKSVFADKFQMKRVITNLLGNAIKYSTKDSEIEIISKNVDNNFVFLIKNTAPTIKNLEKVFDKFESTSNSGLGLYLVKQVINAHKGSVFAKDENDGKYSFGFVIPNIYDL